MKKKWIGNRTKFISNTYMREAVDYDIVTIKEGDLFITVKKYIKMTGPFSLVMKECKSIDYINEGYYVVEVTPLYEHYNIRFYYDKDKNFIDYYIDITYKNGMEYKMPYYVDLYLDIVHDPFEDTVRFDDEDELKRSLEEGIISKEDYDMAYKVGNKLMEEIKNKTNKYLNTDYTVYINKYF